MKTVNKFLLIPALAILAGMSACEVISPREIVSPNVDEETFLDGNLIMTPWVNGMNSSLATTMGRWVELTELISDNYFNDYTQSSKVFDRPMLDYNDTDITTLQRLVAGLRESSEWGLDVVAAADETTTPEQLYDLRFIHAYTFLLAGEYFVGLPMDERGTVESWEANLNRAIEEFKALLPAAGTDAAAINTLIARACYRLGDRTGAVTFAGAALTASTDFVKSVEFDGDNGVSNSMQSYIYANPWFQPLPRLDFLDPKYFTPVGSPREQRSIAIAKAEEPHLILAEAQLAENNVAGAAATMKTLLALVASRPVLTINDGTETRGDVGAIAYPNHADYRVAASADEPLRAGLVLTRSEEEPMVAVPYISGTSVDEAMIDSYAAGGADRLLELLYLMRQEIFFAEGRRVCDLGIRLPVCFKESSVNPTAEGFTVAQLPAFIPDNQEMDRFTMDVDAKTVVILHDMNRVIAENKTSPYVVPFQ